MSEQEAAQWKESGEAAAWQEVLESDLTEAAQAIERTAKTQTLQQEFQAALQKTGRLDKQQAKQNAALWAANVETMSSRMGMTPEAYQNAFGRLSVRGESLIEDGVFSQALASHPPKGWIHAQDGAAAADLWNSNSQAQAVFWTQIPSAIHNLLPETEGYSHSISADTVRHIQNRHGEDADGQLPVTADDIAKIPEIVSTYEAVNTNQKNPQTGGQRIIYAKKTDSGLLIYIEEARKNRNDFKGVTMLKYPLSANVANVLEHVSRPDLYVRNAIAAYSNNTPANEINQVLFQDSADTQENRISEEKKESSNTIRTCVLYRKIFKRKRQHRTRKFA